MNTQIVIGSLIMLAGYLMVASENDLVYILGIIVACSGFVTIFWGAR